MRYLFILFTISIIISCSSKKTIAFYENLDNFQLDKDIISQYITINDNSDDVYAVYSDMKTLSLKSVQLNSEEQTPYFIDKIDNDTVINPLFGNHFCKTHNGTEYLVYLDYVNEEKNILKLLVKNSKNDEWDIFPQKTGSYDFACTFSKDDMFLFYYNKMISCSVLNEKIFTDTNYQIPDTSDIYDLRSISLNDDIHVFYLTQDNTLNQIIMHYDNKTGFKRVSSGVLNTNVSFYKLVKSSGNFFVIFYSADKSLDFFDYKNNKKQKIGYFSNLICADMFLNNDDRYFIFSTIQKKNNTKKNILSIAYKESNWKEKPLVYTNNPVQTIDSKNVNGKIYIVYCDDNLNMITINTDKLMH